MNRWGRLLWRTADKLKEEDLTIFNGECHTPYYYQNHLIKKIFYDYEINIGKGLLRTAYINNFYDKDELVGELEDVGFEIVSVEEGMNIVVVVRKG